MSKRFPTIQFRWPFGRTVLLSALCVVMLLSGLECLLRTGWLRQRLPVPMIGSGKASFDITYERLVRLRSDGRAIDVVFVGTSMVKSAIKPQDFSHRIRSLSGKDIRAFNLSMNSLDVDDIPLVLQLIREEVNPRIIVMEVSPLMNHAIIFNDDESWKLSRSAWGRYRLREWNLRGWMADWFHVFRFALRFHNWVSKPGQDGVFSRKARSILAYGELFRSWRYSFASDSRLRDKIKQASARSIRGSRISKKFWRSLEATCPVILLEVPFRKEALPIEGLTADSIVRKRKATRTRSQMAGFPFVDCADLPSMPLDHWSNMNHLNRKGARVYTDWASDRLAEWIVPVLEDAN